MTFSAFILIFISVFLHAGWNLMSKKTNPSLAFFMIAALGGALPWAVFAFFSGVELGALPAKFYLFFLLSNIFEVLYFLGLTYGYRSGDISLVYPLGRAMPVLLVAAVTLLFGIGRAPSSLAIAGMGVISIGCVILPLKNFSSFQRRTYFNKTLIWVMVIAAGTTGYTIFDSQAMKLLQTVPARSELYRSLFYIFNVQFVLWLTLIFPVLFRKQERQEFKRLVFRSSQPWLAGAFSSLAYVLVLLAMMRVTNVSYLQAFRQMSLPIGVLAGVYILKEPCSAPKIIGVGMIAAGLILTVI